MQIANGIVILSPENQQYKEGITPAESLILYRLHRQYSNGTPLGDFTIAGEAETIDSEAKSAEDEYFNQHTGRQVPPKPAVPAKTHPRTNAEEITRLKKKYSGNITEHGIAKTAFDAVFGSSLGVKLPEKFSEIEELVGIAFKSPEQIKSEVETNTRKSELIGKLRHDLCEIAVSLKLKVSAADSKEVIADAIIQAEKKSSEPAAE